MTTLNFPAFHILSSTPLFLLLHLLTHLPHPTISQSLVATLDPVKEGRKPGTYIGNIATEAEVAKEVAHKAELPYLRYSILDSGLVSQLLDINQSSGALYTKKKLDRETTCPDTEVCEISFDVTVNSEAGTGFFKLVQVGVGWGTLGC